MSLFGAYADLHFSYEDIETRTIREDYNIESGAKARTGVEALMFRGTMSNKNEVVRQAQSRRQVLYLPTPAGVAEMESYSHVEREVDSSIDLAMVKRVAELWQFARAAVADGRIAKMAQELGIQLPRKEGKTFADMFRELRLNQAARDAAETERTNATNRSNAADTPSSRIMPTGAPASAPKQPAIAPKPPPSAAVLPEKVQRRKIGWSGCPASQQA